MNHVFRIWEFIVNSSDWVSFIHNMHIIHSNESHSFLKTVSKDHVYHVLQSLLDLMLAFNAYYLHTISCYNIESNDCNISIYLSVSWYIHNRFQLWGNCPHIDSIFIWNILCEHVNSNKMNSFCKHQLIVKHPSTCSIAYKQLLHLLSTEICSDIFRKHSSTKLIP